MDSDKANDWYINFISNNCKKKTSLFLQLHCQVLRQWWIILLHCLLIMLMVRQYGWQWGLQQYNVNDADNKKWWLGKVNDCNKFLTAPIELILHVIDCNESRHCFNIHKIKVSCVAEKNNVEEKWTWSLKKKEWLKERKTKKKCMQNSNVSKDKTKKAGCVTTIFENQMLQG